jgi:hypothetical protein
MLFNRVNIPVKAVVSTTLIIVMAAVTDSFFDNVSVAPIFCVAYLFIAAAFYPPLPVSLCFVMCWIYVAFSLRHAQPYDPTSVVEVSRFWVRTLTFGVTGCLAVVFSIYRTNFKNLLKNQLEVFSKIPLPIIISDQSGKIVLVTGQAAKELNANASQIEGTFYQNLVGTHLAEEISDNWYERWIHEQETATFDASLHFEGSGEKKVRIYRMGSGSHSSLITVLL